MTSRFTLLMVASAALAGCSSEDPGAPPAPTLPPPGFAGAGSQQLPLNPAPPPAGTGGSAGQTASTGGTGGTAPVGAGGTAAAPAGTAGTAAIPPANTEIPVGMGLAITPGLDAWVAGETNGLGIQGAFTAASDGQDDTGAPTETGSTITLDAMTTPGSVCVSGNLATIAPNPATTGPGDAFLWSDYWGGSLGLNLRQVIPAGGGEALAASPWPQISPAGQVTGFTYSITGPTIPPNLRFSVTFVGQPAGSTYCDVLEAGATRTDLSGVLQSCWEATAATTIPGSDLLTIGWSIVPSETAATPFDFCVSNVQAVVAP
jgi:hypothetical protein